MMALESKATTERFERLIEALEPWLDQIVIVGGWTLPLLRHHSLAQRPPYAPLFTKDADVAVPLAFRSQSGDVRERLLSHGFHEDFLGDDRPPVTHYQLGDDAGFYVEFLTPLVGSEFKRNQRRDVTATLGGVTVQKLRYVEILFVEPWVVEVPRAQATAGSFRLNVVNPVSYVVQKLLVHAKRKPAEQAKDVLYIHDTIELFAASLNDLRSIWMNSVGAALEPRAMTRLRQARTQIFGEVTDLSRRAALIAIGTGRRLSPEAMVETCNAGLQRILG
jgi:hypothetical protein